MEHPRRRDELLRTVDVAATDRWNAFQAQLPRFNAVLSGHELSDDTRYLDLRCLVGHTIPGLIHCKAGRDYIGQYIAQEGPRGVIKLR